MKTKAFNSISVVMVLFIATVCLSSCCTDDDPEPQSNVPALTLKDSAAGTFEITNLSSRETIDQVADVIKDDTLLIRFIPKIDYRSYIFSISCNDLDKVNDSIFIVPRMTAGTHNVQLMATDTIDTNIFQAERLVTLNVPNSYFVIPLDVQLSSDLQSLVNVEISYTDKEGIERKHLIKEDEWLRPDSFFVYKYQLDGNVAIWSTNIIDGYEPVEVKKCASNPSFTLDTRFLNLQNEIITTFTARYIPKTDLQLERNSYEFAHRIDRKSARISIPGQVNIDVYYPINIDLSNHTVTKDNVSTYLEQLSNHPDVKRFKILTNGQIEKVQ